MIINPKRFIEKFESFPSNYMDDFDDFWKWKLEIESGTAHILDGVYHKEAYEKLRKILGSWQYRRSGKGYKVDPWATLEESLKKISNAYSQIRKYSLLEFNEVPGAALESIWHELGRVKESDGSKKADGYYNIISICKPLMLLWGQTPAFDSRVRETLFRENILRKCSILEYGNRWGFKEWKTVMNVLQEDLKHESETVNLFKKISLQKYGSDSMVPYGRLLDIYYF